MISNVKANSILNALTRYTENYSTPTALYLGLCFTEPAASDGTINDEVNVETCPSYKRVCVYQYNTSAKTVVKQFFGSASGGVISNTEEIQFKTAQQAWSTADNKLMYWFLSETIDGKAFIWGEITDASDETGATKGIVVGANTVPTFYAGQLRASIDVSLTTTEATE